MADQNANPFLRPSICLLISSWVSIPFLLGGSASKDPPIIATDEYTSARVCGECHEDIYRAWKRSLHSASLTDPIFDLAFMQAIRDAGDSVRPKCLNCHAPMTMMNRDYSLDLEVSREGVSCDFCHTVTAVHLDGREIPYSSDVSEVKRGVIKEASSPAHKVAFSELHGTAEFCGGCHNYIAPSGSAILGTYDEWRKGPYSAEGIQCQDCHMALSSGRVVKEELKAGADQIHLHSLIHDRDQLRGALTLDITRVDRKVDRIVAQVVVKNVGSGHMVPTGIPSREVVLTVTAEGDGLTRSQQRRFRKVVADERGRPLNLDHEILLRGAQILNDNRIAPREARVEQFTFPVRRPSAIKIKASLSYQYSPRITKTQTIKVDLCEVERVVR